MPRRTLPLLLASAMAAWVIGADHAAAQQSGGSFGSNDFGSSSGGGSSGGGSSDYSSEGSSGGSGGGSSEPMSAATFAVPGSEEPARYLREGSTTRTDTEWEASDFTGAYWMYGSGCCSLLFFGLAFVYGSFVFGRDRYAAPEGPFEVRQVTVAFDWSRRAAIQGGLDEMANRFDGSGAARAAMSGEAARRLSESCDAARYAEFQTFRGSDKDAESRFHSIAGKLRARYQTELAGARASGRVPTLQARPEEGQGLVVVSLVVAWRGHLPPLPTTLDANAAAAAFAGLVPPPDQDVIALEVIWSPAAEEDRLSSAELELIYPELQRLDARGDLGRGPCTYCRAVFPYELGRCPACGAPTATAS